MLKVMNRAMQMNGFVHAGAVLAAFGAFQWVKGKLDASYAASNHPVDYATGQTAFSVDVTKSYYAHMEALGTLDIYRTTQLIDFGFIAGMIAFAFFLSTFVGRFADQGSWARKAAVFAGCAAITGAMFDVVENLISFVMLADAEGFSQGVALAYSGAASLKFALITLGMLGLLVAIVLTGVQAIKRRF